MNLADKTRLVITEDRQTFIRAVDLIQEHMLNYAEHWHPNTPSGELVSKIGASKDVIHNYLAGLSNACDPTLKVAPESIINLYRHTTLTSAAVCFLYKTEAGLPENVAIRLDERLHRPPLKEVESEVRLPEYHRNDDSPQH